MVDDKDTHVLWSSRDLATTLYNDVNMSIFTCKHVYCGVMCLLVFFKCSTGFTSKAYTSPPQKCLHTHHGAIKGLERWRKLYLFLIYLDKNFSHFLSCKDLAQCSCTFLRTTLILFSSQLKYFPLLWLVHTFNDCREDLNTFSSSVFCRES